QTGEGADPEGHGLMPELGSGHKAHAAGRAAGGEIPRPGEARTRKRWGHWGEGYRPSLVRARAPLPKETRNRCVAATFHKGNGPQSPCRRPRGRRGDPPARRGANEKALGALGRRLPAVACSG